MNLPDTLDGDSAAKDSNTDLEAVLLVLLVLCSAMTAVRYVPALQYLNNLFDPLMYNTIWGIGALAVARLFARWAAMDNPWQARVFHRLAASANTALFFGLVTLAPAVGLVVSSTPWDQDWLTIWIAIGQGLPIALIVWVQSWFKGKPVIVPLQRSARTQAHHRRRRIQLRWLAGALVVTLSVLVGGEGVVAQFTPWKTYPGHLDPNRDLPLGWSLEDGTMVKLLPGTEVRARMTPTRREVELVRGRAGFAVQSFAPDSHLPSFDVRAGDSVVSVPPTEFGPLDGETDFVIRRDGRDAEIVPGRGALLNLALPAKSWWASWVGSKNVIAINSGTVTRVVNAHTQIGYRTEEEVDQDRLVWNGAVLSFQGESLEQAVAEMNRFASHRLVIDDPSIVQLPVHGRIHSSYPNLEDQFVLELERHHQVRRTRESVDGTIRLVAFNADPARFGSAEAQLNADICASYRRRHERESLIYNPHDPDRRARFDLASCDLETALIAFKEQSGFEYSISAAPTGPTTTQPLKGRYSAKKALTLMLAGTGCRASGEVLEGLKIACARS